MRSLRSAEDLDLVLAARRGDRDAFHEVYLRHVAEIHRFLRARTNPAMADDLTAETFAKAFAAITRFDVRGVPLRAWLFRIARNLMIGNARQWRDEVELEAEHEDITADPYEIVAGSLDAEYLRACLLELREPQRTVLELRFLNELSVAETAIALGSNDDAVRALTYRALRALRRLYEPDGHGR